MVVFLSCHHSSQSNYSSVDAFVFKLLDSQSCQFCCSCLQLSTHVKSLFISIKTTACHNLLVHCIIMSLLNHPDLSSAHKYMCLCQPHQFCQVIFLSLFIKIMSQLSSSLCQATTDSVHYFKCPPIIAMSTRSTHVCHIKTVWSYVSYQQSSYVCDINIVCSSHQDLLLSCPIQRCIQAFTAQPKLLSSFHS